MWNPLAKLLNRLRNNKGQKGQKGKGQKGQKGQKGKGQRGKGQKGKGYTPSPQAIPVPNALASSGASLQPRGEQKEEPKKDETKQESKSMQMDDDVPKITRDRGSKTELRISPYAWAKLIWLRDRGDTEISVFGLSRMDDLLYIHDVCLVKQDASAASFEFDDEELNFYLFDMLKEGYQPVECMRIWIHTHPGGPSPSSTDKETFDKTTKEADWGIMCIVGTDGDTTARLRIAGAGRQYDVQLNVVIDWTGTFRGVTPQDADTWEAEYQECVKEDKSSVIISATTGSGCNGGGRGYTVHDHRTYHQEVMMGFHNGYSRSGPGSGVGAEYDNYGGYPSGHPESGSSPQTMADRGSADAKPTPGGTPLIDDIRNWGQFIGKEMIHLVEDDIAQGVTTIWTDRYWFQYNMEEQLIADEGSEVEELLDICLVEPLMWGEVMWGIDKNGDPVHRRMSVYANEKFTILDAYVEDQESLQPREARDILGKNDDDKKEDDDVGSDSKEEEGTTATQGAEEGKEGGAESDQPEPAVTSGP